MKRLLWIALLAAACGGPLSAYAVHPHHRKCDPHGDAQAKAMAEGAPWHDWYYNAEWGMPVAVVVPPTAEHQSHYGWGVGNTRVTAIGHQFGRNYPGGSQYDIRMYRPMPLWPSDTDQFGYYYVRGPWR